jgi:hypothetical protein
MSFMKDKPSKRKQDRTRAVLPVRVRGKDASGALFEVLAHTLDLTPTGVRLGGMRQALKALDTVVVLYRQRRIEFTVMWTKLLDGCAEYQAGLQMVAQESDPWGLSPAQAGTQRVTGISATRISAVSGAA